MILHLRIEVVNDAGEVSPMTLHIDQDKLKVASMGNALFDTGCAERWIERAADAPCVAECFDALQPSIKMSLAFALAFAERFVQLCVDTLSNANEMVNQTFAACDASGISVSDVSVSHILSMEDTLTARLTGFSIK